MRACFAEPDAETRPVRVVSQKGYAGWLAGAPAATRAWLQATGFTVKPGASALLPDGSGALASAVLVASDPAEPWDAAALAGALPGAGGATWCLDDPDALLPPEQAAIGWALAAYRFERYRKPEDGEGGRQPPLLVVEDADVARRAMRLAEAVHLARDLINTPASDLGPAELADAIAAEGRRYGAEVAVTTGDGLLAANYPAVHAVGQASPRAPRLVDLRWGEPGQPRLTLVGKGVCFDTGGLDIKPSAGMLLMKKDMGGAAVMLALARLVMDAGLPVRLRLLVPAVENSVAGDAFRPGDVLRTRAGISVEIGNTDAEGRLVLADALAEADQEHPALLVDAATLTGAARVALGPELPALFTPDDALAEELLRHGRAVHDPVWRLPLHTPYRSYLKSAVADINNAGSKPMAGSITAALFLKEFVKATTAWAHLDMFAWNDEARPGRPRGGEATALRALWALVEARFGEAATA
jgi:leucyl aminopeptidase